MEKEARVHHLSYNADKVAMQPSSTLTFLGSSSNETRVLSLPTTSTIPGDATRGPSMKEHRPVLQEAHLLALWRFL